MDSANDVSTETFTSIARKYYDAVLKKYYPTFEVATNYLVISKQVTKVGEFETIDKDYWQNCPAEFEDFIHLKFSFAKMPMPWYFRM